MSDKRKLLFEVQDKSILLWMDNVAISFADLAEWKDFADQMLGMIPEMVQTYGLDNDE